MSRAPHKIYCAPFFMAASIIDVMFSSLSVMKGSTGESQTPVVTPARESWRIASSRLLGEEAFGSINFARSASRVVMLRDTRHGDFFDASEIISMSLRTRSDLVPMANGQL